MRGFEYALSLPVSVVPAIALAAWFRRLDRGRMAPRRALYATMALGALACVPAALIEFGERAVLGDASIAGGRFVDAFVVAAFTEEVLKLLIVLAYPFRRSVFDEVMDGVVYTVAASLGFGLIENLAFGANDVGTGMIRAFTAVPMHAIASGIMGYFVGRARFSSSSSALPLALAGLFCGVFVHGLYDWAVFNHDDTWFAESIVVLAAGGVILWGLVKHAMRMDESMLGRLSLPSALASWPSEVTQTLVPTLNIPKPPEAIKRADSA